MKIISVFITGILLFSCTGNNKEENTSDKKPEINSGGYAVMTFEEYEFDFGTIKEGEKVTHEFKFKNTGTVDLHIVSVQATCGCTSPEYPSDPIAPNGEDKITVTFDSNGRPGNNGKKVQILYNGKPKVAFLKITANVQ